MNFVQLEYFVKAAQCLSFTEAARQLYVTQPTLSNGITKLESSLGAKLFIRDKHAVCLTAAGKLLYDRAVQILELCQQATDDVQRQVLATQNLIRLGVMGDLLGLLYADMVLPFIRQNSHIRIRIDQAFSEALDRGLTTDTMDIILSRLGSIAYPEMDTLNTYLIQPDRFYLALPGDHPYAGLSEVSDLSIFEKDNFIMLDPTRASSLNKRVLQMCQRRGLNPSISYSQLMDTVLVQVASGMGISIVPGLNTYVASTPNISLIRLLPEDDTDNSIVIAWKKSNQNPSLKAFLAHIFNQYPGG